MLVVKTSKQYVTAVHKILNFVALGYVCADVKVMVAGKTVILSTMAHQLSIFGSRCLPCFILFSDIISAFAFTEIASLRLCRAIHHMWLK